MNWKISIIVPVFNTEKYLPNCLDSIINQTYSNIEVILVNDGSSDSSGIICDEYALKDSRIIVVHNENGGVSSARNIGLDIATGDYIMFVDSDDYLEPQFCEIPLFIAFEKNVDIVSFGYYRIYNNGRRIEKKTKEPREISSSEGIFQLITKEDVIYNLIWNKLYKRQLFSDVRFPNGKLYEDNAVIYLLFHKAKKIFVSDSLLYNYLYRDTSITADWYKPKSIIDRFTIWLDRLAFVKKYYPENVEVQITQLASEAIIGLVRLTGIVQYRKIVSMFSSFLDENKQLISKQNKEKTIKLYYFNKYFFYLYCLYFRLRFKPDLSS